MIGGDDFLCCGVLEQVKGSQTAVQDSVAPGRDPALFVFVDVWRGKGSEVVSEENRVSWIQLEINPLAVPLTILYVGGKPMGPSSNPSNVRPAAHSLRS